mmetsp:Transcript_7255/g.10792  ORF Transcript_7255/g.10792 Transcript_7255/m.10792 type:complete len:216 (-) Transcript_7255:127-774(-)
MITHAQLSVILTFTTAILSVLCIILTIVSLSGASVERNTLEETPWIFASGSEESYIHGDYYAGINAIYFVTKSNDKDVIKYTDCADDIDICKKCNGQSIGVTVLLMFGLIFASGTLLITLASKCVPNPFIKCSILSAVTLIFLGAAYSSFGICHSAFKGNDTIEEVEVGPCYESALAAIVFMCAVFAVSLLNQLVDYIDREERVTPHPIQVYSAD